MASTTRQERKQQTRDALLAAALGLTEFHSFDHLSLRQVTKEVGIVPGGFYRHFRDMDELGLALVDRCFSTLYDLAHATVDPQRGVEYTLRAAVTATLDHIRDRPAEYRFIVRERNGGSPVLRRAIAAEQERYTLTLADWLRAVPDLAERSEEHREVLAGLIVAIVAGAAASLVDPAFEPVDEAAIARLTEQRLRVVFLGAAHWEPDRA
ncbi:MAG: TetR family transcriptional regulator [Acidimicrobiales bacterium]|nr:TetR family transcriptional regulator [Acidimicrobiales bacterium]